MHFIRTISTKRFDVELSCEPDDYSSLSDFDDETRANIDDGTLTVWVFYVRVYLDGRKLSSDSLGGSVYEDPDKFAREHIGARGRWGSYYPDMVRAACQDARKLLNEAPRVREVE
jgi:hypothetical protein